MGSAAHNMAFPLYAGSSLALVLALVAITPSDALDCLDNAGKAVPWFFTYKFPNGYDIAYVDSSSSNSQYLKQFERPLDDKTSPVALIRTLRQLSKKSTSLVQPLNQTDFAGSSEYLLYNDQPDKGIASSEYGHTKGVVASDGAKGIWLVHSTPHFPSASGSSAFYFPETEIKYGQTFLCFSFAVSDLNKVAGQLLYNHPYVYASTYSDSTGSKYPNLGKVLAKEWITDAASNVASVGKFTSFAKNSEWNDDLYEKMIATHYKSDLYVESWLRGSKEGSYCKPKYPYEVVDVSSMVAGSTSGANVTWTEGDDHAKWAVMLDGSSNLCIGDINRMTTQRNRGGGAVCFSNSGLSSMLYNSIDSGFDCAKRR